MGLIFKPEDMMKPVIDKTLRAIVGNNVRYLRKGNGMKQMELAEKLGWLSKNPGEKDNRTMVSQIENGHVGISLETLRKLANAFHVPMGDLLREHMEDDYPDPASIPEIKQANLVDPDKTKSALSTRRIRKQKVFRYSDIIEALGPTHDGFSIPFASFRLPDWTAGRKSTKLVCAVIDDDRKSLRFKKGTFICLVSSVS